MGPWARVRRPRGWHCTKTWCPQPFVVHKDVGWAPRLIQSQFIISINDGNHAPGLWECTEVGTVTSGGQCCHPKLWGGCQALQGDGTLGEASAVSVPVAEEPDPGCWQGNDIPVTGGATRER